MSLEDELACLARPETVADNGEARRKLAKLEEVLRNLPRPASDGERARLVPSINSHLRSTEKIQW